MLAAEGLRPARPAAARGGGCGRRPAGGAATPAARRERGAAGVPAPEVITVARGTAGEPAFSGGRAGRASNAACHRQNFTPGSRKLLRVFA